MNNDEITPEQLERIFEQKGFGNPKGRYWFIGMEEGGEGTPDKLRIRSTFAAIEDLAKVQHRLGVNMARARTATWSIMSRIVLKLGGERNWNGAWLAKEYRTNKLGRQDGDTFLAELLPLPSPGKGVWTYQLLLGHTRQEYERETIPRRVELLRGLVAEYRPSVVVCYGKGHWPDFSQIFPGVNFASSANGDIYVGKSGPTRVALTPFLRNDQWGKGFSLVSTLSEAITSLN